MVAAAASPAAGAGDRLKLFISYSRSDLSVADALVTALEGADFDVTIDRRDLPYGEEWQKELADFIRASDTVVWLVSPGSVKSKWCNWELGEVTRLSKRLVPVKIRDVVPEELPEALGKIHLLPAAGVYDPSQHFATLASVLETDRAWLKEGTRLADRARQWIGEPAQIDPAKPEQTTPARRDRSALLSGGQLARAEAWRARQPAKAPRPSQDVLDLILTSREAATRWLRLTVAGAVAVAVFGVVLAGVAIWQRNAAERNYAFAIDAAEDLAIGLARDIRGFTGVKRDRLEALLKRAENVFTKLESSGATPRLLRSRAWMDEEAAQTYSEIGNLPEAARKADQAIAVMRQVWRADKDNPDGRIEIANALDVAAEIARAQSDVPRMRTVLEESVKLRREAVAMKKGDPEALRGLAKKLQDYSLSMMNYDKTSAEAAITEAAKIYQEILPRLPNNPRNRAEVLGASYDLAMWLRDQKVQIVFLNSLLVACRLAVGEFPKDIRLKHLEFRTLQRLSDNHNQIGEAENAEKQDVDALDAARILSDGQRGNFQAQLDLSFAYLRLASSKRRLNKKSEAGELTAQSIEIARGMVRQDARNTQAADFAISVLHYASVEMEQIGAPADALSASKEALSIARRLAGLDPTSYSAQSWQATLLWRLTSLAPSDERLAAAREAIEIYRRLESDGTIRDSDKQMMKIVEKIKADLDIGQHAETQNAAGGKN